MSLQLKFIPVSNKDCVGCGHLVTYAKVFHESCHFSNGNTQCPAAKIQIGLGMNTEKASDAIATALFNKDVIALQKHVNRLAGYNTQLTEEVLDMVFDKTALMHGIEIGNDEDDATNLDDAVDSVENADGGDEGGDDLNDALEAVAATAATLAVAEVTDATDEPDAANTDADADDEWADGGDPTTVTR